MSERMSAIEALRAALNDQGLVNATYDGLAGRIAAGIERRGYTLRPLPENEAAAGYGPLEPAHQEAARLRRGLERIHRIGTHPAKNAALRLEQLEEIAGITDYALALSEPDTALTELKEAK